MLRDRGIRHNKERKHMANNISTHILFIINSIHNISNKSQVNMLPAVVPGEYLDRLISSVHRLPMPLPTHM